MHFSSDSAFDFSDFTHARNKKGHAAEAWQIRCPAVPVKTNIDSKIFSPLTHHSFKESNRLWDRDCYVLML